MFWLHTHRAAIATHIRYTIYAYAAPRICCTRTHTYHTLKVSGSAGGRAVVGMNMGRMMEVWEEEGGGVPSSKKKEAAWRHIIFFLCGAATKHITCTP